MSSRKQREKTIINRVQVLSADNSIDTSDLQSIFSNKSLDAEQLRKEAWQRKIQEKEA